MRQVSGSGREADRADSLHVTAATGGSLGMERGHVPPDLHACLLEITRPRGSEVFDQRGHIGGLSSSRPDSHERAVTLAEHPISW